MKIVNHQDQAQATEQGDLTAQTFQKTLEIRHDTSAILSLLEAPPEGSGEPDPILQLMDCLVRIEKRLIRTEQRLMRLEKRFGIQ